MSGFLSLMSFFVSFWFGDHLAEKKRRGVAGCFAYCVLG